MTKKEIYSVLLLRDLVMFPKMIAPLFVGRESSIKALESVDPIEQKILLIAQKNSSLEIPQPGDIFKVGVVSKVLQVLKLQNNNVKVLVEGLEKVKIHKFITDKAYLQAEVSIIENLKQQSKSDLEFLQRTLKDQFEEYVRINKKINGDILGTIMSIKDPLIFADAICSHVILPVVKKQKLLEATNLEKKLENLITFIESEIEFLHAENRIKGRVKNQIEKSQRDYYLNEQLKAIHKELGDDDSKDELNELAKKISTLKLSKEAKEKSESELKKLRGMNAFSSEANVIRSYLDWIVDLPWGKMSVVKKDLKKAQEILDDEHYGLEKIKERIIEYLAVNNRTKSAAGPIICLMGPPGVGKTSLAKSVANATGRKFVKVALGGLRDEAEVKGHRRTYVGALPGRIIQAMKKAGTNNPLILLDEIDKIGMDHRSDPAAAMLEVLDPEQNKAFNDHYLEVDYDLSKVMFITTANSTNMTRPLLDRLELIRLSGYTEDEKVKIGMRHLIPKQATAHGIKKGECSISEEAILNIIRFYTREAGVRNLDRSIAKIMRKAVKKILTDGVKKVDVTLNNLKDFLGVRKYNHGVITHDDRIGITNGLSYSEVGGDLLEIEAVVLPGKGEVKTTGKLGDVMKESAMAAISYIRSKATILGIDSAFFKDHDIHIHVPEGAVPKDGPSAGVAICVSVVSAITGVPVRKDIAMTGEITLSGRVLEIGGLKEKLLAALRGGVKTVLLPIENLKDIEEMPDNIKTKLTIIGMEQADEALKIALAHSTSDSTDTDDVIPKIIVDKLKKKKTVIEENLRH